MADEIKETGGAPGAAPATIEEALPIIAGLQEANTDLSNQLNDSKTVNLELKAQLKEATEGKIADSKNPVIEINGVTYEVLHGDANVGDAKALSENEDACRKILAKKGQNALKEI